MPSGADPGFWERGGGGSNKYIHSWGRVREGACLLPRQQGVFGGALRATIAGDIEVRLCVDQDLQRLASLHSIDRAIKCFVNTHVGGFNYIDIDPTWLERCAILQIQGR